MFTKICTKCSIKKPLSEFYQDRGHKDGLRNDCKNCNDKRSQEWKNKYKKKVKIREQIYRELHKQELKEYNKIWQINHPDNIKQKYFNRKTNTPWKYSLDRIKQRCNNKNNPDYNLYGGRGIKCLITEEELKFLWFRDNAYQLKIPSIDRKNSNGNYTFENCQYIEQRENISKANTENKSIKIVQYGLNNNFIKEWNSAIEVERELKILATNISNNLNNRSKTAGGFKWRYKNAV